ncbi:hypothetical protein Lal_00025258 [Lupinus albus]|nr:hypothetical protein Lal_00025258 [Lupinus albus]
MVKLAEKTERREVVKITNACKGNEKKMEFGCFVCLWDYGRMERLLACFDTRDVLSRAVKTGQLNRASPGKPEKTPGSDIVPFSREKILFLTCGVGSVTKTTKKMIGLGLSILDFVVAGISLIIGLGFFAFIASILCTTAFFNNAKDFS